MAEKEATERRVYNLPADLLERLRAFQVAQGISSEAEAARRLLDSALQMKDSISNILNTLEAKFVEEKDLRILASDILMKHALVISVQISDTEVSFYLRNGEGGQITSAGTLHIQAPDDERDRWYPYKRTPKAAQTKPTTANWDTRPSNDLDDEIPF